MKNADKTKEQLIEELAELRRRNAELEASKSEFRQFEEKYRVLVENANEAILVAQDGRLKFVNPKAVELAGYSEDELSAKSFVEFIHPDDQEMVVERYMRRLKGEELPQIYPFRFVDKYGNIKWVEISADRIIWEGRPATLNLLTDITERKQAEEALTAESNRLAVTLRSIGDGVIATDVEGRIALINDAAETLTGWTRDEAIGKPLDEIFHIINEDTRERCENPVERVLETGKIVGLANRTVLIARDGTERIIADSGAPIHSKDSNIIGAVVVFRDITEKRKMEEELLGVQKLESIGILAGGIAHDLNNLLTGVVGNISLARLYEDPVKKDKRLAEAEKASMRIKDLTQQLLTFSKGGTPILQTAAIGDLLKTSATFILSGANVRCEFSMPDDLWTVIIDAGQINQVVNNLIINAQQAMPDGGTVKMRAENITIGAESGLPLEAGVYIKVSIEDEGMGIPKKHIQKIFDPFFSTKQTGSGLGLATSYSIIKKHNGHLTVESQLGAGTTFHIYLPASSEAILIVEEREEKKPIIGEGRILVMDDEELVRELASDMLTRLGYEVITAIDGAEAIELYKAAMESGDRFAAVIVDLTVPGGMGGRQTIQRLIEIDPEVKAIVSSGYSNDPILANFTEYGFKGVVAKPYKIRELSEVLHRVTNRPINQ